MSGTAVHQTTNEVTTKSTNNIQSLWNRSRPLTSTFTKHTTRTNCGYGWSAAHRQSCPARGKNCKNYGIANHFEKKCRKPKQQIKPKRRVNNVEDTTSEAATVGTSASVGEQVNHIERLLQKRSVYDEIFDFDCDDFDYNCFAANST